MTIDKSIGRFARISPAWRAILALPSLACVGCAGVTSGQAGPSTVAAASSASSRESAAASAPAIRDSRMQVALTREKNLDYAGARAEYEAMLKESPARIDAALGLARIFRAEGNNGEAEKTLSDNERQLGHRAPILIALGSVLLAEHRSGDARELGRRVLFKDQSNADALALIVLTYVDEKKLEAALVYCQTALSHLPKSGSLNATLAYVFYKRGELQKALDQLQKTISVDPENATAHLNLGLLGLSFHDFSLATKELELATTLGSKGREILAARCYALAGAHAGKPATDCFSELVAKLPTSDPDLASYLYSLGLLYQAAHDGPSALAALHRYVGLKSNQTPALPANDKVFQIIRSLEKQSADKAGGQEKPNVDSSPRATVQKQTGDRT